MIDSKPKVRARNFNLTFLVFAFCPAVLVILSLFASVNNISGKIAFPLFALTVSALVAALIRLFKCTLRSTHSESLAAARAHVVLHMVPFLGLALVQFVSPTGWIELALLAGLLLFFASGRIAWRTLKKLIPTTKMYALFYRGNSTLLALVPILYLTSLLAPSLVGFGTIKSVLLSYFAIHFSIVGIACLRIDADLRELDSNNFPALVR
jgi:hypothetical protein